jgi:hypothetical protein
MQVAQQHLVKVLRVEVPIMLLVLDSEQVVEVEPAQ